MRVGRARVAWVLLGVSLAAQGPLSEAAWAVDEVDQSSERKLHVLLTVAPGLPPASRFRLIAEATDLWSRAGVHLIWLGGSEGVAPAARKLRVLVIPRRAALQETSESDVLGELLALGRPGALAVASIDHAERLVAASRRAVVPKSLRDEQLGLVLGRVVAHEIGHYLLNTPTHAPSGLMRATFETADLVDYRSGTFELDAGATATLHSPVVHTIE